MGGFWGKLVRVNLSTREITNEELSEKFFRTYYGGAAVIGYFLLKELPKGIDPLGPENKLIFAPGVITGVPIAGCSRNSVGAKSPLSNGIGKSEAGGFWGAELKRAGIDVLIIEGKADHPVYLWINDDTVEIKDARHLWGKTTKETQESIRTELGQKRVRTALIGRGGEKLVKYACIVNDLKHTAGRTGMGAVMGSKYLKGIAVLGSKTVPVEDGEDVKEIAKWVATNYKKLIPGLAKYGTGAGIPAFNEIGNLPVRNFRDGYFEEAEAISPVTFMSDIGLGMEGCYACPIRCKKVVQCESTDPAYGGAEYETLAAFGSNCGIGDARIISAAHSFCNANSIDTISAGVTMGFAMECFEEGILKLEDTGGIELTFGNGKAMLQVLELIVTRKGIGDLLAEGVARVAKKLGKGSEKFAMHIKGVEFGLHEPRLKQGMGLGFAIGANGADHCNSIHDNTYTSESAGLEAIKAIGVLNPMANSDLSPRKVSLVADAHRWINFQDSALMCIFPPFDYNKTVDIVKAVTGWNSTVYEAMKVGERSIQMARVFNIREGITSEYDCLPERSYLPTTNGALKETSVDKDKFRQALLNFYKEMGWSENGIPDDYTLEKLEIGWAADYLK
ncbi:MAG: aldehyde ferredoxin oxidoreductase family protein [Clostridiaceae bacterium]|nr:aldehyde ferredoxin oxidoreductase family protein [Clostridiaceae bacterium]